MAESGLIPVYVALVAGTFAVLTSLVTICGLYITHFLAQKREHERLFSSAIERKQQQLELTIMRFRNPFMAAATRLVARLNNMLNDNFSSFYNYGTASEKSYAVDSTAFLFGQYFAWQEILYQETQFLGLGEGSSEELLQRLLTVERAFSKSSEQSSREFRLFAMEQRACGEVMIVHSGEGDKCISKCMGYAAYASPTAEQPGQLSQASSSQVHMALRESFCAFATAAHPDPLHAGKDAKQHLAKVSQRLEAIHQALSALITTLEAR